ncbi:MAG TPA: DoxX family protein [Casimicrobiaceae bacterium]|jgi:putative oxidoreductase|nr:DoxX family protein [Casimicrobiaceae bacterium]
MNDRRIDLAALVLRLTLGTMLVAHGLLKYLVFTPQGTAKFFESIGLPGPLGYLVIAAEVLGGMALLLGYRTRVVALSLVPILFGSALPHLGNGWLFSAPGGGWEYSVFMGFTAIAAALLGDGRYALRWSAAPSRRVTA